MRVQLLRLLRHENDEMEWKERKIERLSEQWLRVDFRQKNALSISVGDKEGDTMSST